MQLLKMHREDNHRQPAQVVESSSQSRKAEKVCRPTIKMGSSEDDFIFFQCLFESYKRSCQLKNVTDIRDQLLACCETDLRRDLHRYLVTGVDNKTEVELLAEIKKIAVISRSNLVNVVSLMSAAQEHGESCRSYLAKIRGLANVLRLQRRTETRCPFLQSGGPIGIGGYLRGLVHLGMVTPGGPMIFCQPRLTSLVWWTWRK